MGRQAFLPLAVGIAAFLFFSYVRAYPTELAGLLGLAFLLLTWAGVRTWDRLRETYRDKSGPGP